MDLSITRSDHGQKAVLHVAGAIDIHTAPVMRARFDELLLAGQRDLVADLSDVTFMDSTGLGVLVGRLKLARSAGGWLSVVATSPRVVKVFELTGLDRVFDIYDTVEAALAAEPGGARESEVG